MMLTKIFTAIQKAKAKSADKAMAMEIADLEIKAEIRYKRIAQYSDAIEQAEQEIKELKVRMHKLLEEHRGL